MSHILRQSLDITKPISNQKLTVLEKLEVGWRKAVSEMGHNKLNKIRQIEQERKKELEIEEDVYISLSKHLNDSINKGVDKAIIEFPRVYKEHLENILQRREFKIYTIKVLACDQDLITLFGDRIPILLEFKTKEVI